MKEEKDLFKNAGGDIETFLSKCKMVHAKRIFSLDPEHMFIFTKKDLVDSIDLVKKNNLSEKDTDTGYLNMYM